MFDGDKQTAQIIVDELLNRADLISNAVFSKNLVKVKDTADKMVNTNQHIVETINTHALRPGLARPSPAHEQMEFTAAPPGLSGQPKKPVISKQPVAAEEQAPRTTIDPAEKPPVHVDEAAIQAKLEHFDQQPAALQAAILAGRPAPAPQQPVLGFAAPKPTKVPSAGSVRTEFWRQPTAEEEGEGSAIIGIKIKVDGLGPGVVKSFSKAKLGASAHVIRMYSGEQQKIKLARKGSGGKGLPRGKQALWQVWDEGAAAEATAAMAAEVSAARAVADAEAAAARVMAAAEAKAARAAVGLGPVAPESALRAAEHAVADVAEFAAAFGRMGLLLSAADIQALHGQGISTAAATTNLSESDIASAGVDIHAARAAFALVTVRAAVPSWGLSESGRSAVCAARPVLSIRRLEVLGLDRPALEAALGATLALMDWKAMEARAKVAEAAAGVRRSKELFTQAKSGNAAEVERLSPPAAT